MLVASLVTVGRAFRAVIPSNFQPSTRTLHQHENPYTLQSEAQGGPPIKSASVRQDRFLHGFLLQTLSEMVLGRDLRVSWGFNPKP